MFSPLCYHFVVPVPVLYDVEQFKVPCCELCGGIVKLDVVMFGDNVPQAKVDAVYNEVTCYINFDNLFIYINTTTDLLILD
jgi:NAD-dependent SIR2 family protein deacetylase